MREIVEPERSIAVVREVDVLVVGGGPAGFVAATAAARRGAKTLLLERYGCLGGLATGGLVLYMDSLADKTGQRAIGGLPWEALERCRALGGIAEDAPLAIHADSEVLKFVADSLCVEAGVELRLHSWAVSAITEDGRVRGVVAESKSGRQAILCRVCIDATGDGDIAALAGAACDTQTQCIGLNLKVGGVNLVRFREFQHSHPEELRALHAELRARGGYALWPGSTPYSGSGIFWVNILGVTGRLEEVETAMHNGRHQGDVVSQFAGRLSALDVEDLTYAEVTLRRQLMLSLDFYRQFVPGFEQVMLLAFASQLGVRDSRRVRGLHMLTKAEMVSDIVPADSIGKAGSGFCPANEYHVPYGCLVPEHVDGLLVSGRCISVDDYAQQAVRLIPPAMVTGQAAGTAAALACASGREPRQLDSNTLRTQLLADGVLL